MQVRHFILILIAVSTVIISLLPEFAPRLTNVQAQGNATTVTLTNTATGTATNTSTLTQTGTPPTATPTGSLTSTPTFTPLPTATPTFTPFGTPQPTATKAIRVVNEITQPKPGDAVAGLVSIEGTALIDAYHKFDLHIAVAGSEDWQWVTTAYTVVHDARLYWLDSTQYKDGFYDLRVRAISDNGNYSEAFLRHIEIRNANPPTPTPLLNELGTPLSTQPFSPILLAPTATPTPNPAFVSHRPDGQGIFAPMHGDVLRGVVDIIATVNGYSSNPFNHYELALSNAGKERWTWLYSSEEQFWQESVYPLDTRRLPDGLYDLRLRVVYRDSNYSEYFVRNLYIANHTAVVARQRPPTPTPMLGIFVPANNATVGGIVEVLGVANINNFQRWELAISPSGAETWSFMVSGATPVAGLIARLDLSRIPLGNYDLRLRVISSDNEQQDYFARTVQLTTPTPTITPTVASTPTSATTLTPKP
ncbi:MAG: hypothetical protein U0350_30100 [Caldilineaceae bacterium]